MRVPLERGVSGSVGDKDLDPIVWRVVFPPDITEQVVSYDNPSGTLTNSDLELAAIVLHQLVLERVVDLRHNRAVIFSDNTPAVAWVKKMNPRAAKPIAHYLLRGLAMRQRATQGVLPEVLSIAGTLNTLADVASRRIEVTSAPGSCFMNQPSTGVENPLDHMFLTYFNSRFPLVQHPSWKLVHPSPGMLSKVILTLRGQRLAMRQWTTPPEMLVGGGGFSTPPSAVQTPISLVTPGPSNNKYSWPLPPGFELASSETRGRLDTSLSRKVSVTWRKPSCWLDSTTHDGPTVPRNWIFPSATC